MNKSVISISCIDLMNIINCTDIYLYNILDVRDSNSYKRKHIPNSINIPYDVLEISLYKLDITKTYYVICDMGIQSLKATCLLLRKGFNAINVSGGYNSFQTNKFSN